MIHTYYIMLLKIQSCIPNNTIALSLLGLKTQLFDLPSQKQRQYENKATITIHSIGLSMWLYRKILNVQHLCSSFECKFYNSRSLRTYVISLWKVNFIYLFFCFEFFNKKSTSNNKIICCQRVSWIKEFPDFFYQRNKSCCKNRTFLMQKLIT